MRKLAALFNCDLEINGHLQHNGDIESTGDLSLKNSDCVEEFDIAAGETADAGTVVVLQ